MSNTAVITHPLPYSETCDTFRAAARTARITGSGGKPLVDFLVHRPVPHGFVAELVTERGPCGVKNGLRHVRPDEPGRVHVADDCPKGTRSVNFSVLAHEPSRLLVQVMPRYWKGVLWTPSYFAASAGGAPLAVWRRYVEEQRASSPA